MKTVKTAAGIDLGTQSIKVVLYDFAAKEITAKSSCPLDIIARDDGTREQKTQWYVDALKKCFDAFTAEQRSTIAAVGVSGQQHGFVPLDKSGKALYNVKLWNDTSTVKECKQLTEKLGGDEAVIEEVGNLILPGFTAPKILWLKNNDPEAFAKLHYVMLPHDYINYVLTGAYCNEAGDASGTALFNPKTLSWSKKACDAVDPKLFNLMAPIIKPYEPCGAVSVQSASFFGIPSGIPVSAGGGDNMMGAIGTGTVSDGFLTMSLGTSGTLYGFSAKPLADPKNGLSGFCSSSGGWLPLLCTMNCTVATEQIRTLFGLGVKEFDALAAEANAGAEGVVVLPFFNGERTPNLPNGRASITGLTAANTSKQNIARAAMESAIFAMRGGLDAFTTLGFKPKEIRLIGGGAKSALWRSITADITGLPVRVPMQDEAAALGAAVQALWCLQTLEAGGKVPDFAAVCAQHISIDEKAAAIPDSDHVKAYNKAYALYKKNLEAVMPLYQ